VAQPELITDFPAHRGQRPGLLPADSVEKLLASFRWKIL